MTDSIETAADRTSSRAGATQAVPTEAEALVAHILERFHATHRRELPLLRQLALEVETAHAAHPECPRGLAGFLAQMLDELEHHMMREERVLFPTLLAGGGGCAPFALRQMRHEHAEHDERLADLKRRTHDFEPPEDACGGWRKLYAGCEKLSDDLRRHIDIENNVLFPMFE